MMTIGDQAGLLIFAYAGAADAVLQNPTAVVASGTPAVCVLGFSLLWSVVCFQILEWKARQTTIAASESTNKLNFARRSLSLFFDLCNHRSRSSSSRASLSLSLSKHAG